MHESRDLDGSVSLTERGKAITRSIDEVVRGRHGVAVAVNFRLAVEPGQDLLQEVDLVGLGPGGGRELGDPDRTAGSDFDGVVDVFLEVVDIGDAVVPGRG